MCTLSWQIHNDYLNLVFNRDELRSRPVAHAPEVKDIDGVSYIAPLDTMIGGTWIAANQFGVVAALLNNYRSERNFSDTDKYQSRGVIVRKLAASESIRSAGEIIRKENLHRYQSFDVLVFCGIAHPQQWSWDGKTLSEIIAPASPVVSSSLHPEMTEWFRKRMFRKADKKGIRPISADQQLKLHQTRYSILPWYSPAMKRSDRATVSITEVQLTANKVKMRYHPGDPKANRNPVFTQKIPVQHSQNGVCYRKPSDRKIEVVAYKQLLFAKNKPLYDSLSKPAFWLIRKAGREKTVNRLMKAFHHVEPANFPQTMLHYLGVQGRVVSRSCKLPPSSSRPLFIANHPTGGLDGLLMLSLLNQYYNGVKMVVTDLLEIIPQLRPYIIPVDRYSRSKGSVEVLQQAFAGDYPLLVFPAGATGRKQNGIVRDPPWNKMPVTFAKKHNRTIVPVYINSTNSFKFNGLARLRKILGFELNLEMMLLPAEFFNPARREFELYLGEPVTPDTLHSLADTDTARIAELRKMHDTLLAPQMKGD